MSFSFAVSTREVLEQLVQDPRFRALTTIGLVAPLEVGLILGAFGVFGISSYLFLVDKLPLPGMLLLNSLAVYASFTPLHDATHRTLSANRRLNDLLGSISCLLLLPGITTRIYRYLHLEHHRYAGEPGKDPDEPFVSSRGLGVPLTLAGLDVLWTRWYVSHWHSRPVGERREFVLSISFYVLFHLGWLLSPYALEFILVWVLPQRLGLFYVAWFFARIQHPENVFWEEAPFQTTVRVITTPFAERMLLGQANHHVHHLAPSLPWYRYSKAWELGKNLLLEQNIPTRTLFSPAITIRLPEREAPRWLTARVARVADVAADIRSFELVPAAPDAKSDAWPTFSAGAHIDLRLPGEGNDMIRQYSLCNSTAEHNRYLIAVKHEPAGRGGSHFLYTHIASGEQLEIGVPRNNFPLRRGHTGYVLIAGGIGLTPLLAMGYELYRNECSFELHLFAKNREALAFHDSLADLPFAANVVTHFSELALGEGAADLSVASSDPASALTPYSEGRVLYLCGPTGFMARVIGEAESLDWPMESIFTETFVSPQSRLEQNSPFEVLLARTGQVLQVGAQDSLLDVLNANGCAVICSCTQGICGSCLTPVLEGVPDHRDALLSRAERDENKQMTVCVSRARSERLVLDL